MFSWLTDHLRALRVASNSEIYPSSSLWAAFRAAIPPYDGDRSLDRPRDDAFHRDDDDGGDNYHDDGRDGDDNCHVADRGGRGDDGAGYSFRNPWAVLSGVRGTVRGRDGGDARRRDNHPYDTILDIDREPAIDFGIGNAAAAELCCDGSDFRFRFRRRRVRFDFRRRARRRPLYRTK